MTLDKVLKYLTFFLVTAFTINNIATFNIMRSYEINALIAIKPYDLIIANDIKTLEGIKDLSENIFKFASSLNEIDKNIKILDLQKDKIKLIRKYVYNEEIKSYLIECEITLHQRFIKIEQCAYNQKIYSKLKEITKQKPSPVYNYNNEKAFREKNSNDLIKSIYEKLLNFKIYESYITNYLKDNGIETTEKDINSALSLLDLTTIIENIDNLIVISETKSKDNYIISKDIKYSFDQYTCETKIVNKLLYLENNLRSRAPLNSPPITIDTICKKSP
jgi:hypothetical protein